MSRRLPLGEETLPIIEVEERMVSLEQLKVHYPDVYRQLITVREFEVSDELLIERVRQRHAQGRVPTIYRFIRDSLELSPEQQIWHMEHRTDTGLELIEAERKLLEEEINILRGTR